MRVILAMLICSSVLSLTGCLNILDQYYNSPKHFFPGTAKVRNYGKSVDHAYNAALTVLEQRGWGVAKKELNPDSAMIRANKNAREMIIDIKGEGDSSEVRIEIDQSGNEAEIWAVMTELDMLL